MTGGTVVILGPTGKNFGAGMTGGVAYVLDLDAEFPDKLNKQLVTIGRLEQDDDVHALQALIYKHLEVTESALAKEILGDWETFKAKFWKVYPNVPTAPAPAPAPVAATPAEPGPANESKETINENVTASR
jgi:glutamate synthase (NADPH/NADH) large chain/glutamate synthase (ferredoxin)